MKRLHLVAGAAALARSTWASAPAKCAYLTEPSRSVSAEGLGGRRRARLSRRCGAPHLRVVPSRIYKGRLPPLIHGVVVVETTVDASGHAARRQGRARPVARARRDRRGDRDDQARRPAAGADAPRRRVRFTEIWLVHKDGRFQLDALTEGQD